MQTFAFQGHKSIYFGAQATLLDFDREVASEWAKQHVVANPAHSYVLGKFVEADKANNNNQYFTLDGLQMAKPTIAHAPLNINHKSTPVGTFVASELIYPSEGELNPYIESLGVFWKYYFPEAYFQVKAANEEGSLFFSMECVPRAVSSIGGADDSVEYPYEGRTSPNYPGEINDRSVPTKLHDPHFVGGALIIPPERPGWSNADVKQISSFMDEFWQESERVYASVANAAPDLAAERWETLMGELILMEQKSGQK